MGETVLYGQPFTLNSIETGRFLGATTEARLPAGRFFAAPQSSALSMVAIKWADWSDSAMSNGKDKDMNVM